MTKFDMFFITGDTHGQTLARLKANEVILSHGTNAVLFLGDTGFQYNMNIGERKGCQKFAKAHNLTLYILRGNHENRISNNPNAKSEFDEAIECKRLLEDICRKLEDGATSGNIIDINGNKVGQWSR